MERSEDQRNLALNAMDGLLTPEFSPLSAIPQMIFTIKQKVLFGTAIVMFGLGAYGWIIKNPVETIIPMAPSLPKEIVAPVPTKFMEKEVAPQKQVESAEQKNLEPEGIAPSEIVTKPTPKLVKAKVVSVTTVAVAPKSAISSKEVETIRDLLQRASLEGRFDPERARGKMQVLLVRAKGHPALTQSIRQEMNLIQ